MLALYRSGRQADALEAYRRARATLVEQIGVEPGPELRRLHAAILRQDASLDLAGAGRAAAGARDERAAGRARRASWSACARRGRAAARGRGARRGRRRAAGIGRTRLAAELARRGAARGRARALRRCVPARARADRDAARARRRRPAQPPGWRSRSPRRSALVIATRPGRRSPAAGAEHIALGPLDADGVAAIARHYAPDGRRVPVAELAARSGGRAGARASPRRASGRARRRRAGCAAAADRAAAERDGLRRAEQRLAGDVVELQALRERAGRARTPSRPRPCARTRASRRSTSPTRRSSSGASGWWPRWSRGSRARRCWASWARRAAASPRRCAPGCCPSWPAACCRAARTGRSAAAPRRAPAAEPRGRDRRTTPQRRLLVAVDQFEEAFTLCRDEGERAAFVDALVGSRRRQRIGGRPRAARRLLRPLRRVSGAGEAARRQPRARRPDAARRAAPRDRAARRSARACASSPSSSTRLLADVEDEPGALPLLSTALLELWQQRDGRHLRLAAYERTGGVRGAVARLAEAAYDRLDPAQQTVARAILLRLAGEDAERRRRAPARGARRARRRPRRRPRSARRARRQPARARRREAPRRSPTRRCCASGRGCARWLEEDAEGRRLHRHLAVAAREWEAGGRDPGELYRGARLASTLDWSAGTRRRAQRSSSARSSTASVARGEREARRARRANRRLRALLARRRRAARCSRCVAGALFLDQRGTARDEARGRARPSGSARRRWSSGRPRPLAAARPPGRGDRRLGCRRAATCSPRCCAARPRSASLRSDGRPAAAHGAAPRRPRARRRRQPGARAGARRVWRRTGARRAARDARGERQLARHSVAAGDRPRVQPRRLAARGGPEGKLELLDGRSWRRIAAPKVPQGWFTSLAFSPDGRVLVRALCVGVRPSWVAHHAALRRPDGRPVGGPVGSHPARMPDLLAFGADGRRFVTREDDELVLRDARTLRALAALPATAVFRGPQPGPRHRPGVRRTRSRSRPTARRSPRAARTARCASSTCGRA